MKGQGHACNRSPRRGQLVDLCTLSIELLFWCDITHTETELPIQGPIRDNDHNFKTV